MTKNPDQLLSMQEIAAELGIAYSTLRKYRSEGRLPPPDVPPVAARWRRDTIKAWHAARPGRGSRLDT